MGTWVEDAFLRLPCLLPQYIQAMEAAGALPQGDTDGTGGDSGM